MRASSIVAFVTPFTFPATAAWIIRSAYALLIRVISAVYVFAGLEGGLDGEYEHFEVMEVDTAVW